MAVDMFAQKYGAGNFRVAHSSFMADVFVGGEKVLLMKPQTYMNLVGRAVASAMSFYKLSLEDLLVVVDDVALPVGVIRLRASGSAGGHNGLKDIEGALFNLATAEGKLPVDYQRLRIGIDSPGRVPQKAYVLESFSAEQKLAVEGALKLAVEAVALWAERGIVAAMNRYNVTKDKDGS